MVLSAALNEISAMGAEDTYMYCNPTDTIWKGVYQRITNFALAHVQMVPNGNFVFGSRFQVPIQRAGDLLHWCYLHLYMKNITYTNNSTAFVGHTLTSLDIGNGDYAFYTDLFPLAAIRQVRFLVGQHEFEVLSRQALGMWHHITKPDHLFADEAVHALPPASANSLLALRDFGFKQHLYAELPFYFHRSQALAFPLIATQGHDIMLEFETTPFQQLCHWNSTAYGYASVSTDTTGQTHLLSGEVIATVVLLDALERRMFAESEHDYLIEQTNQSEISVAANASIIADGQSYRTQHECYFSHPTTMFFWAIQRNEVCPQSVSTTNNNNWWFNWAGKTLPAPVSMPAPPFETAQLFFNSQARTLAHPEAYYRIVQAQKGQKLTIPRGFVYQYRFGTMIDDWRPWGTANLSRISNVVWEVVHHNPTAVAFPAHADATGGLVARTMFMCSKNKNVSKHVAGMAGLHFA